MKGSFVIIVLYFFFLIRFDSYGIEYLQETNIEMNALEDTVVKDTTKLLPNQNLKVSLYSSWEYYNLLIREKHTRPSNFWLDQLPYKLSDKKFQKACKKAIVPLLKSTYPEIVKLITRKKIQSISFILNFDDRKEFIDKYFMVHVKSASIPLLDAIELEMTKGDTLANMIKKAMEQVYEEIPVLPRESLPDSIRKRVEAGERGYAYFTDIFVEIEREDLWRYKKK